MVKVGLEIAVLLTIECLLNHFDSGVRFMDFSSFFFLSVLKRHDCLVAVVRILSPAFHVSKPICTDGKYTNF